MAEAVGPIRRQLEFLRNGYSCYAHRERARADDLLVRERAAAHLQAATATVRDLASAYRRRYIPDPSSEHPFPSGAALAGLRQIERLQSALGDAAVRVRDQALPASDRTWARLRSEHTALDLALAFDDRLILQAEAVRRACTALTAADLGPAPAEGATPLAAVGGALGELLRTLEDRGAHLALPG